MTTTSGASGVGAQLGQYRLESLVGRGAVGEVFRARDLRRNRTVALKLLAPQYAQDTEFAARFRRECQLVAELTNPHIVPIHDYGEIAGRLYMDMRLVDGPHLGELVSQHGRLSPALAVDLLGQVASALAAAHAKGLVHRDVKPSNVLTVPTEVGDGHFAALSDFGVARSVGGTGATTITGTGSTMGTLEYMAPERFRSDSLDHRVDIYALGCVLHECLTGQRPYPVHGLKAIMEAHESAPVPRPSDVVPGIPAALDQVVATAMAKDPDERYATAGQFANACRAALAGGAGTPPPPPPPPADPIPEQRGPSEQQGGGTRPYPDGVWMPPPNHPPTSPWPQQQPVQPGPEQRKRSPWVWIGAAALAVIVLIGAGIAAFALGRSGSTAAPPPATPTPSAVTSFPNTFPTTPATPAAPSAAGYTLQTMFAEGGENGPCTTETTATGAVASMSCTDPKTSWTTFYDQTASTYDRYVASVRSGAGTTMNYLGEDACSVDYQLLYTGSDNVAYQAYMRVFKKSPWAYQTVAPASVSWQSVLDAKPPVVGSTAALCGT
ncbi:serine/threonine-protein kinase [Actinomycetospora termitidis]|uniref:non-specific serine/threonine protein kinase n=1 Tax=Actinomycetospora termitidis TaxID=3053470 RepID=A0ABT7ME52_9PSEU|nr:serine/threonine-protein kinase [Actinomycetospora sp. Odt1-22]MDL5158946.1 serine/threonine-protein kinase [Actinomycetospora sp. Odt1-22]